MPYVIGLEEVSKASKNVGGKAANLGEMIRAGLPVPFGFAVTTEAYEFFLRFNKLDEKIAEILKDLDVDDQEKLNQKSKEVEQIIIGSEVPDGIRRAVRDAYENLSIDMETRKLGGQALDMIRAGRDRIFVAVRSSATAEDMADASFAGQMRTYVNISGMDRLIEAIKRCWASLFTPRAVFYRKKQGIAFQPAMGVAVQKMVDSEKSGVLFTADPTTNDKTKMVIESAWGLGQVVVSGLVTPDEYILDKQTGKILSKKIGRKAILLRKDQSGKTVKESVPQEKISAEVLTEAEVSKLWDLARRTENWYGGQSQDMEWCVERGRVFLVQTRPITTLNKVFEKKESIIEGKEILSGSSASPGYAKGKARIVHSLEELSKIQQGDILVAKMTSPDFVPYMKKAVAIITDEGGRTSHAAIVSRELAIPCIVGTFTATQILSDGQEITVDAVNGKVYSGEVSTPKQESYILQQPEENEGMQTATEIKVNMAFPEMAERAPKSIDGVGLLRAEHILTEHGKHPIYLAKTNPDELVKLIMEKVGKVASVFYPKPVWYRSLDARTDEFQSLEGGEEEPKEANPMLGWHGIRRSISQPEILKCEMEALKQLHEKGMNNISLMLPFVIGVEELRSAKSMATFPLKIGIMVETPAAVMELENFCKEGIDFVSIGSNDLTQLTLGVDRGNSNISNLYSEMHPAVLKLIRITIDTCKKYGVKSSICGEGPSNIPELVEKLVEFGIDSISVELDAIQKVKNIVSRTERRMLLEKIRSGKD